MKNKELRPLTEEEEAVLLNWEKEQAKKNESSGNSVKKSEQKTGDSTSDIDRRRDTLKDSGNEEHTMTEAEFLGFKSKQKEEEKEEYACNQCETLVALGQEKCSECGAVLVWDSL